MQNTLRQWFEHSAQWLLLSIIGIGLYLKLCYILKNFQNNF